MRILFSGSKLDWTINAFVSKNYFCFVALEIQNKYLKYKAYTRRHNKMELTLKNMPPNLRIRELQLSLKFSLCSSLIPSPCLPCRNEQYSKFRAYFLCLFAALMYVALNSI